MRGTGNHVGEDGIVRGKPGVWGITEFKTTFKRKIIYIERPRMKYMQKKPIGFDNIQDIGYVMRGFRRVLDTECTEVC